MNSTDRIFSEQGAYPGGFQFDEQVVRVFPDMISRSVPGYELIIPMIGMLARRHAVAVFTRCGNNGHAQSHP
jgi:tRNA (cmo5U34)-methyltransferase